ncbi:MAG: hypothetical protein HZB53_15185 [Chloroflexi bacterium]|nr:hypothetical protein [Chloroflexota bacterium]
MDKRLMFTIAGGVFLGLCACVVVIVVVLVSGGLLGAVVPKTYSVRYSVENVSRGALIEYDDDVVGKLRGTVGVDGDKFGTGHSYQTARFTITSSNKSDRPWCHISAHLPGQILAAAGVDEFGTGPTVTCVLRLP